MHPARIENPTQHRVPNGTVRRRWLSVGGGAAVLLVMASPIIYGRVSTPPPWDGPCGARSYIVSVLPGQTITAGDRTVAMTAAFAADVGQSQTSVTLTPSQGRDQLWVDRIHIHNASLYDLDVKTGRMTDLGPLEGDQIDQAVTWNSRLTGPVTIPAAAYAEHPSLGDRIASVDVCVVPGPTVEGSSRP